MVTARLKIKLPLFLLISLSLVLVACRKPKQTTIHGTVREQYTGVPVSGAYIELYYSPFESGVYSSGYALIGHTLSDPDGQYRLTFDNVSAVDFKVKIMVNGYFERTVIWNRDEVNNGASNEKDLEVYELAELRLHFKNSTAPQNSVLFKLEEHSEGCLSCCSTDNIYLTGVRDTVSGCGVYANQTIGYKVTVFNASSSKEWEGSIVIQPGVNQLNINYD